MRGIHFEFGYLYEMVNPLGIISPIMSCISGASYPSKRIMALLKEAEYVPRAAECFH